MEHSTQGLGAANAMTKPKHKKAKFRVGQVVALEDEFHRYGVITSYHPHWEFPYRVLLLGYIKPHERYFAPKYEEGLRPLTKKERGE